MGGWSRDGKGFSKQVENEKCTLRKLKNVTTHDRTIAPIDHPLKSGMAFSQPLNHPCNYRPDYKAWMTASNT